MDFDDTTRRIVAHLKMVSDTYLLGPVDFSAPFRLLDRESLESPRTGSFWLLPGKVVQELERLSQIRRFEVNNKTEIGFRIVST
jgi:hypothetical protein